MFDVITIGSASRDVLLKSKGVELRDHADSETGVEQCFPLGSKIEVDEIVFASGGGGTNAAVTFARQGFDTACVSAIGDDIPGEEIMRELKKEDVDTKYFQKHQGGTTAYSIVLVHPNGERTILSYKGEGQHFLTAEVPFARLKARWFYLDSMGGHYDLFAEAVKHATDNNIKIACNPGGKELAHGLEKLKLLLAHMDIYITNKDEGAGLVWQGAPDMAAKTSEETARELKKYVTAGIVVVSDGHHGVTVIDAGGQVYVAGVPDSPVVERTGAGDAFGSGFTCEYARSSDVAKAIQFGTANASAVVTQFGAKAGILKKGDWGPWPLVEVNKK